MPYGFTRQRGFGKWGEKQVIRHFEGRGCAITDVSEDKEYQGKGIDLLIQPPSAQEFTADVKLDMLQQRTGNLFIETKSSADKIGCALATEADYFLYFCPMNKRDFPGEGRLFWLDMKKFQEWFKQNDAIIRATDGFRSVKNEGYESEGIVVAVELLKELDMVKEEPIAIEIKT